MFTGNNPIIDPNCVLYKYTDPPKMVKFSFIQFICFYKILKSVIAVNILEYLRLPKFAFI